MAAPTKDYSRTREDYSFDGKYIMAMKYDWKGIQSTAFDGVISTPILKGRTKRRKKALL
jgi:hypothetical protein